MSLHTHPSPEANRRVKCQRCVAGAGGVLAGAVLLAGLGAVLDGIPPKPEPAYRPQFVSLADNHGFGCVGGCIVCGRIPLGHPALGKPTPPQGVGPLGLAPKGQTGIPPWLVHIDAVIPPVNFPDSDEDGNVREGASED